MNLANKLTVSRIGLTFVFMFFLFSKGPAGKFAALIVFLTACLTDMLDGFIAKSTNTVTDFGRLMDPIADKVLVLAAFLAFVELEIVPAWIVVIIMLREFLVTGLRILALTKGKVIPADAAGRHKTASQYVAIFATLLFLVFREMGVRVFKFWTARIEGVWAETILALMLITMVLTTTSGISYLVKNREVYLNAKAG